MSYHINLLPYSSKNQDDHTFIGHKIFYSPLPPPPQPTCSSPCTFMRDCSSRGLYVANIRCEYIKKILVLKSNELNVKKPDSQVIYPFTRSHCLCLSTVRIKTSSVIRPRRIAHIETHRAPRDAIILLSTSIALKRAIRYKYFY